MKRSITNGRWVLGSAIAAALAMTAAGCGGSELDESASAARGSSIPDGVIVQDGTRAFLKGIVTEKSMTTLVIAGMLVDTSAAQFRDARDAHVAAAQFFDLVQPGVTRVKVRWDPYTSPSAPVEQAEIDLD